MVPEVLCKNRSEGRSPRGRRPVLCGAVILLLTACAAPTTKPPDDPGARAIDPGIFVEYSKTLREYQDALLLLDSPNPRDWADGKLKLEALDFAYFEDDRKVLELFRTGTPEQSDLARRELARRGKMIQFVLVFADEYKPATWEHARTEMLKLGPDAAELLTDSLLRMLLNGKFIRVWPQIRFQLVAIGRTALVMTAVLADVKANTAPRTAIFKEIDLVQLVMVLIGFGEQGRAVVHELSKHRVWNVRKAVAKAIGESIDVPGGEILVNYLKTDSDWQVKAAAAEAIGQLRPARNEFGPILLEGLKAERDGFVQKAILRAIGRLQYLGAIPVLMNVLDVPNYDTMTLGMEVLYSITGERITSREEWKRWYRETYPDWIKRQTP